MTTATAERNVRASEREERRQRVEAEKQRLSKIAEAKANDRRVKQLDAERAGRVAEVIADGSRCSLTVNDGDVIHKILVRLSAVEPVARASARAALYALVNLLVLLESEKISGAWLGGEGPMISKRLVVVMDGDEVRQAQKFGMLTASIEKAK